MALFLRFWPWISNGEAMLVLTLTYHVLISENCKFVGVVKGSGNELFLGLVTTVSYRFNVGSRTDFILLQYLVVFQIVSGAQAGLHELSEFRGSPSLMQLRIADIFICRSHCLNLSSDCVANAFSFAHRIVST